MIAHAVMTVSPDQERDVARNLVRSGNYLGLAKDQHCKVLHVSHFKLVSMEILKQALINTIYFITQLANRKTLFNVT